MNAAPATILLVDDEPDILRILTFYLSNAGYRVVQAHGVQDAIRKMSRYPIDMVLTDLAMPGTSGVTFIEYLRGNPDTSGLPIIAVTAFAWDPLGRNAADYGVDGFISKPVGRELLLQTILRVWTAHSAA